MINEIQKDAATRMQKSVDALQTDLSKVRTGRAHTGLLDQVSVDYYGSKTPLSQVANINVEDARTLNVSPWEKDMVKPIEKAIINSGLGLNPSTAGTVIRIPVPPMTEERRKDMVKVVRAEAEGGRVAIRNIRRDANSDLKSLEKEKEISEDELHRAEEAIQKLTDQHVTQIDSLLEKKEKELMAV
jgi:ribosome recycling factor